MTHLQSKLYVLLKEINDICKKNDIEYFLAGGTALGAIRGGGFLPWDDDIDLYITEKNWQKLVKVMESQTPDDRIFVCVENDHWYRNVVGRYVDKETTVMMKSQMVCGKACGQLLEFFIFDPMPLGEEKKREHRQKVKIYSELLTSSFVVNRSIFYNNREFDQDLYKKYRKRCETEGEEKVLNELLTEIKSNDEDAADSYCMRWGQRNLIYTKEMFGAGRPEKFEDDYFPVPAQQEKVARIAYGDDWMYIPEGAGKVVHDLDKDLDTPFQQYVDMYMSVYDKQTLQDAFVNSKNSRADSLYKDNMYTMEMAKARAELAALNIKRNAPDPQTLRGLIEEGKTREVIDHLSYLFLMQSNPTISNHGVLIPVGDEILYAAVMAQILSGRYYKASKLLQLRTEKEEELTEDLKYAKSLFDFCRDLSVAIFDDMDEDRVRELLDANQQYKDIVPDHARGEVWLLKRHEDYPAIIRSTDSLLEKWPHDGELMGMRGYALYMQGRNEEAAAEYEKAVENTRNGYIWRQAKELCNIEAYTIVDHQPTDDEEEEEEDSE